MTDTHTVTTPISEHRHEVYKTAAAIFTYGLAWSVVGRVGLGSPEVATFGALAGILIVLLVIDT